MAAGRLPRTPCAGCCAVFAAVPVCEAGGPLLTEQLVVPNTRQGADYIFRTIVKPTLMMHEENIDAFADEFKEKVKRASSKLIADGKKIVVKQTKDALAAVGAISAIASLA